MGVPALGCGQLVLDSLSVNRERSVREAESCGQPICQRSGMQEGSGDKFSVRDRMPGNWTESVMPREGPGVPLAENTATQVS